MRQTTKNLAPDQGGRERGKTDGGIESVAAAEPARRDGTPQHRQAQYERLCRAVGTGHAPNINGDAHVRYVLMILRQRPLELRRPDHPAADGADDRLHPDPPHELPLPSAAAPRRPPQPVTWLLALAVMVAVPVLLAAFAVDMARYFHGPMRGYSGGSCTMGRRRNTQRPAPGTERISFGCETQPTTSP